jgi:hypothetical protein
MPPFSIDNSYDPEPECNVYINEFESKSQILPISQYHQNCLGKLPFYLQKNHQDL